MKCVNCGSENSPAARFCLMCGQSLAVTTSDGPVGMRLNQIPYGLYQQVELQSSVISKRTEYFLYRLFGGISWLMVAAGTFIVASGYLGVYDTSYYADPTDNLRMIGYGIVVYGIAAIFVAMNRFFKSH